METISNETKAKEFANYFVGETDYKESDAYSASISMAEWKEQQLIDKANKKGAAYSAAMAMAQWKDEQHKQEKQQLIDEACEWWKNEFKTHEMKYKDSKNWYNSKVERFKQAMKGE